MRFEGVKLGEDFGEELHGEEKMQNQLMAGVFVFHSNVV